MGRPGAKLRSNPPITSNTGSGKPSLRESSTSNIITTSSAMINSTAATGESSVWAGGGDSATASKVDIPAVSMSASLVRLEDYLSCLPDHNNRKLFKHTMTVEPS